MKPTDAFSHPDNWAITSVGEQIEVKRGISWSKEQEHAEQRDDAVPVIRIGNVQETLELDDLLYVSGLPPKAIEQKRVSAGWSVMVGSNGNRNRIGNAVYIEEDTAYLFASFLVAARPKASSSITSRYFYRWLTSEPVQAYLTASSEGSTGLNNLSHSFFRSMSIAVPSPAEQVGIARILDAADTAIERIRDAIGRARELQVSLLTDIFERMKAERQRLGDYIADARYGTSQASSERGWGNPVLRIPNVIGDQLTLDDLAFVDLRPTDIEKLALQKGDLLMVRSNGNPLYIGRSAVFNAPDSRIWVYASYLICIRLSGNLLPDYVNIFLGTELGRRELLRRVTTSAGNNNININNIRLLSIPIPESEEVQRQVIQIVTTCRALTTGYENKLNALNVLKKSLMHDLLSGKARVPTVKLTEQLNLFEAGS